MSELYRENPDFGVSGDEGNQPMFVRVEPVAVVTMTDHVEGFYSLPNVYLPDLSETEYKVALVLLGADDE
mgnify:CR=1 FL=1